MSNKNLVTGIVIGVAVTATVCYIMYLQNEKKRLSLENDFLYQRVQDNSGGKIININSVPKPIRQEFKESTKQPTTDKFKETYKNSLERVVFLKNHIENRDGYKIFYNKHKSITKEKDLHILYDLTWYGTKCDVNKEVDNGRGPVDFKISKGLDQTLVEFKLASNSHLKRNLENQVKIYAKANHSPDKIIGIIYTTEKQETRVKTILNTLNINDKKDIVLIDARMDNKPSASVA